MVEAFFMKFNSCTKKVNSWKNLLFFQHMFKWAIFLFHKNLFVIFKSKKCMLMYSSTHHMLLDGLILLAKIPSAY